jgi:hypothetical protein
LKIQRPFKKFLKFYPLPPLLIPLLHTSPALPLPSTNLFKPTVSEFQIPTSSYQNHPTSSYQNQAHPLPVSLPFKHSPMAQVPPSVLHFHLFANFTRSPVDAHLRNIYRPRKTEAPLQNFSRSQSFNFFCDSNQALSYDTCVGCQPPSAYKFRRNLLAYDYRPFLVTSTIFLSKCQG